MRGMQSLLWDGPMSGLLNSPGDKLAIVTIVHIYSAGQGVTVAGKLSETADGV
jgi:hypothetical protein